MKGCVKLALSDAHCQQPPLCILLPRAGIERRQPRLPGHFSELSCMETAHLASRDTHSPDLLFCTRSQSQESFALQIRSADTSTLATTEQIVPFYPAPSQKVLSILNEIFQRVQATSGPAGMVSFLLPMCLVTE